jgi:Holliday junction resolvase
MASKHQTRVIKKMETAGWFVVNLIKTNKNGIPDLMCLKDGKCVFIECKEKNDTLKPLQAFRIKQLQEIGFDAYVDKVGEIDKLTAKLNTIEKASNTEI